MKSLGTVDSSFVNSCKRNQHLRGLFYDVIPPLTDPKELKSFLISNKRLNNEDIFENFMEQCAKMPMHIAAETIFPSYFNAKRAIFWKYNSYSKVFESRTLNITLVNDETLIYAAAKAKIPINVASIENKSSREQLCVDINSPQLVFPFYLRSGEVIGVLQLSRENGEETFSNENVEDASFFIKKYSLYGTVVTESTVGIDAAGSVSLIEKPKKFYDKLCDVFSKTLNAKTIEIWYYIKKGNQFFRFNPETEEFEEVKKRIVGIVGFSLMTNISIMERNVRNHSNYNEKTDGKTNSPIMTATGKMNETTFCVAVRGRTDGEVFSSANRQMLDQITPFLILSISYSFDFIKAPVREDGEYASRILDLVTFGERIVSFGGFGSLVKEMIHSLESIFKRHMRFTLVWRDRIYGDFTGDLDTGKNYVDGNGITGFSIYSQAPVILPVSDKHFLKELDVGPYENIQSVIAVPIFSASNDVIGCLTLLNEEEYDVSYKDDMGKLSAYAVFCGIALQNAMSIKTVAISLDMLCQYKSAENMEPYAIVSMALNSFEGFTKVLSATLFAVCDGRIVEFESAGSPLESGNEYARLAYKEGKTKVFRLPDTAPEMESDEESISSEASDAPKRAVHSPPASAENRNASMISKFFGSYFCCSPVVGEKNEVIGVFQYCFRGPGSCIDAVTAAAETVSVISKSACLQFIEESDEESAINNIKDVTVDLLSPDFDPSKHVMKELATAIISYFAKEGLIEAFSIKVPRLYKFIRVVAEHCRAPLHNFNHAVLVFSQVLRMVTPNFSKVLRKDELISLLLAALVHDIAFEGFEMKQSVPYELLLQRFSPQELRSCSCFVEIISDTQNNFIAYTNERESIIKRTCELIKSTNMQYHFSIIERLEKMLKSDNFTFEDDEARFMTSKLIIKAGDIGSLNRSKDLASTEGISDEFFAEGDYMKLEGITFTSSNSKERKDIHWLDSLYPFLRGVVEPTFDLLSRLLPELSQMNETVKERIDNL